MCLLICGTYEMAAIILLDVNSSGDPEDAGIYMYALIVKM